MVSKEVQYQQKIVVDQLKDPNNDAQTIDVLHAKQDSLWTAKKKELEKLCTANPDLFFTKVARAAVLPKGGVSDIKANYFDNLDFTDTELIRSTVFPKYVMGYLKTHSEISEPGFQESIDLILDHARVNPEVYAYCLEYLLEIFDQLGPATVFKYIVEEHLIEDGCSEIDLTSLMKGKAEAYVRLLPGKTAPNISIPDATGKLRELERVVEAGKINLLFFWSSQCDYCEAALPELKKLHNKYKAEGMQVIAVSLDENQENWIQAVEKNDLNWIHLSDLNGWKSSIVQLYKIDRTPTYFLLDGDMEIISKPRSVEELKINLVLLK